MTVAYRNFIKGRTTTSATILKHAKCNAVGHIGQSRRSAGITLKADGVADKRRSRPNRAGRFTQLLRDPLCE